jgi:hypothetical protein
MDNAVLAHPLAPPDLHRIFIDFDKSPQRPVIGSFYIIGEKARRQLLHAPVILEALAADAFTATGFIGTVAILKIFVFLTFFHGVLPSRTCYRF